MRWDCVMEFLDAYLIIDGLEYGQSVPLRKRFYLLLLRQSHLAELLRRYGIHIGSAFTTERILTIDEQHLE